MFIYLLLEVFNKAFFERSLPSTAVHSIRMYLWLFSFLVPLLEIQCTCLCLVLCTQMLYSYIKGLQFSATNDCPYKMGLLCFCPMFFTRHRFFFCTELLYNNVFAVFLLFWFQRGRLQFKRFLIIWEINNCVMFVSFSRMLSARWSFPTDYSNYACDFYTPSERKVCLTSSNFECRLFWSD